MGRKGANSHEGEGNNNQGYTHAHTHTHTHRCFPNAHLSPNLQKRYEQHKMCVHLTGNPAREKSQTHAE